MDCNDIRRVRTALATSETSFMEDWEQLNMTVDAFRRKFPIRYDPDASFETLWWGDGNFMARDMGLIYLVTGDKGVAADLLRLLELVRTSTPSVVTLFNFDTPNGRGNYSAGGVLSHPAYGAVVPQSVLFGYFAIRNSPLFTDQQRLDYDAFFKTQAELYEQAATFRGNFTSIQDIINRNVPFAANTVALTFARAFPDDQAMQQLDARVWPTLEWQLQNWWHADGGWGEDVQNYGFSRLESTLVLAETTLRYNGEDMYAMDFTGHSLNTMCRFFLETVTPEGTVPALNDTSHFPVDPGLFRLCGFRTSDPELFFAEQIYNESRILSYDISTASFLTPFHRVAWADLGDQAPEIPGHTSVMLETTGAAILRGGWERNSPYALLQFTGSRSHEEYSYGALYLFDQGPWLVGNGYQIPTGRSTSQHSTVALDDESQTFTGGTPIAFADFLNVGLMGVSSPSYPNFNHTRLVLWIKPLDQWIVIDDILGDASSHSLQQRWYVRGQLVNSSSTGWVYAQNANDYTLLIKSLSDPEASFTQIKRNYDFEPWVSNAVGMRVIVPYIGKPVRMVTSLAVVSPTGTMPVPTRQDGDGGTIIDIQAGDTVWKWFLPDPGLNSASEVDFSLNGVTGCVLERGGSLVTYCLVNGSDLSYKDRVLADGNTPFYLEADLDAGQVRLSLPAAMDVAFYWPSSIQSIMENGKKVDFSFDGGMVTLSLPAGWHLLQVP